MVDVFNLEMDFFGNTPDTIVARSSWGDDIFSVASSNLVWFDQQTTKLFRSVVEKTLRMERFIVVAAQNNQPLSSIKYMYIHYK
jgi:hypothetical protein